MKLLFLLIIFCSCSQQKLTKRENNKYSYLQEFYKLRDQLKSETKLCQQYTQTRLKKLYKEIPSSRKTENSYTLSDIDDLLHLYTPELFDWKTKAKIQELYLSYKYSFDIVQENFEIIHNIKDCMNEFEHLSFIKATINSMQHGKVKDGKTILSKYFNYISEGDISPLSVMLAGNIVHELDKAHLITIKNPTIYNEKKKKLEKLFTKTGRESLKFFREKNFQKVYELALNLKNEKDSFRDYLIKSIILK